MKNVGWTRGGHLKIKHGTRGGHCFKGPCSKGCSGLGATVTSSDFFWKNQPARLWRVSRNGEKPYGKVVKTTRGAFKNDSKPSVRVFSKGKSIENKVFGSKILILDTIFKGFTLKNHSN